ncbi:hypothetical protein [Streptomyces orinoci]|uniref:HEAT repeat domain-containing protein n=1 Tax=Streptomyces orinoci TaxID=67339 RepID=A0ABV3K4Q2_STRON|nr:hypothetical protein [Streptomyces orinoci]
MDELSVALDNHSAWCDSEGTDRLIGQLQELATDDNAALRQEALSELARVAPELSTPDSS